MRRLQHTRGLAAMLAATGIMITGGTATADMATVPNDPDEVRAIVAEMLADSQTRSSLLASGNAGHDGAFFLASDDGNYKLQVKGFMQFRYHLNFRDGNNVGDDFTPGFNAPRTVLFFKGHVADPNLSYQIRFGFRRTDGTGILDDAFINYKFDDNWSVRIGQGLHPFSREWYHGDVKLQTIERSLVALALGDTRSQGIALQYRDEDFRVIGTFSDGFRSLNTDLGADPADYAFSARAEVLFAGGWKDVIGAYTSPMGSDYAAMVGGAIHFEQGPDTPGAGTQQELFAWTADATIKGDGWNVFVTGTGFHTTDEAGVSGADFEDFGFVAQGGVYLSEKLELYARYTALIPDSDRLADEVFDTVTVGLNYYMHGHAARFTIQGEWFLDATTDTVIGNFANTGGRNPGSTLFGLLPDDDENQVTLSAQFQLLF